MVLPVEFWTKISPLKIFSIGSNSKKREKNSS